MPHRTENQLLSEEDIRRATLKPGETLPPAYTGFALDGDDKRLIMSRYESGVIVEQREAQLPIRRR